ncbi:MAG: GHKL domain-containing protein [Clostridiaceae bacterium]
MACVQEFILQFIPTVIELTAFIFILDTLIKESRNIKKYCFIIVSASILYILAERFNIQAKNYLSYIYLIGSIIVLFKKSIWEGITEFGISLGFVMIFQIVIMMLINITPIKIEYSYLGIVVNSFLLIILVIINRFFPLGTFYDTHKDYIKRGVLFIIIVIFYALLSKYFWENDREIFNEKIVFIAVITLGFVALNMLFVIYNVKYERQKKVLETYNRYSAITANLIDDIKKRQHEFKNHINTIYGIAQVTDEKLVKGRIIEYIQNVNKSMQYTDYIIQVKDEIIAAIIYNKVCEAKYKNIDFAYEIDNNIDLKVNDYELSEILNNLMDNAFEAVDKIQAAERKVQLKIYREKENKIIEVKNTIADEEKDLTSMFFNKGFSSKKEEGHGYGLYNVKRLVESNNGKIQVVLEGNLIKMKILF